MVLSPLDIKNKTFSTKLRGFSPEEVDDFLDQVVLDYEDVIRQKRELEKSLRHAEEKLSYFNELKDALNQSIIVAQDTADKLKDNASKESNIIVTSAESKANEILTKANEESRTMVAEAKQLATEIIDDATNKIEQLASETDDLKKKTRSFYRNLTLLLEEQVAQLQSDEWEEILKPFDTYLTDRHEAVKSILQGHPLETADANVETVSKPSTPDEATLADTLASLDAAGLLDDEVKKSTAVLFPDDGEKETEKSRMKNRSKTE